MPEIIRISLIVIYKSLLPGLIYSAPGFRAGSSQFEKISFGNNWRIKRKTLGSQQGYYLERSMTMGEE